MTLLFEAYLPLQGFSCIYGAASTGKTTLAMLASLQVLNNRSKVLFLDTEGGFSSERFQQLGATAEQLDHLFLFHINSFKNQHEHIEQLYSLIKQGGFGLVVVDTINSFYRRLISSKPVLANSMLKHQMTVLQHLSKLLPVIITSQVSAVFNHDDVKHVGGQVLTRAVDRMIKLVKEPRTLVVEKPDVQKIPFRIVQEGICFDERR